MQLMSAATAHRVVGRKSLPFLYVYIDLALDTWASHSKVDTSIDVLDEDLDRNYGTSIDGDRGIYTYGDKNLSEPELLHFLNFNFLFTCPSYLSLFFPFPYDRAKNASLLGRLGGRENKDAHTHLSSVGMLVNLPHLFTQIHGAQVSGNVFPLTNAVCTQVFAPNTRARMRGAQRLLFASTRRGRKHRLKRGGINCKSRD